MMVLALQQHIEYCGRQKGVYHEKIKVTVWNEYLHELQSEEIAAIYPEGIHGCIAGFLQAAGMETRTATLRQADNGLPQDVLDATDVLVWWGHMRTVRWMTPRWSGCTAAFSRAWG